MGVEGKVMQLALRVFCKSNINVAVAARCGQETKSEKACPVADLGH
ncbi:MAG: hypothetical protein WCF20_00050 [Methylovirgula sp.]